jgi:nucleoside-diphosphate-sugar epimerase
VSETERVLVIGGTRGTGRLIAELLLRQGRAVRVLARDPASAARRLDGSIEIVPGDITKPSTLPRAVDAARAIILTAGCRSGHPARERRIRETEFEGVRNVIAAARSTSFGGRLLYMTSSGVTTRSLATVLLNLYKGNTLLWRLAAEVEVRRSGLDYTIIRAGFLLNAPGGRHSLLVTQNPLPLSLRYRIARQDVAEAFVAALAHPTTSRTTFEIVWGKERVRQPWSVLLDGLRQEQ